MPRQIRGRWRVQRALVARQDLIVITICVVGGIASRAIFLNKVAAVVLL